MMKTYACRWSQVIFMFPRRNKKKSVSSYITQKYIWFVLLRQIFDIILNDSIEFKNNFFLVHHLSRSNENNFTCWNSHEWRTNYCSFLIQLLKKSHDVKVLNQTEVSVESFVVALCGSASFDDIQCLLGNICEIPFTQKKWMPSWNCGNK